MDIWLPCKEQIFHLDRMRRVPIIRFSATGIIQMVLLPVPDMQIWKLIRMETGGWFVWEFVPLVLHSEV